MEILYISYDGALDFVSRSQVVPYLERLAGACGGITLLSFEKKEKLKDASAADGMRRRLKASGVEWVIRTYHKRPVIPASLLDVAQGVMAGCAIIIRKRAAIVHARGYMAALMGYILKLLFRVKFIFDMRGFWPDEKVDAGVWKNGGMLHRLVKRLERVLLKGADEIVVLTEAAKEELLGRYGVKARVTVVPCCVDLDNFRQGPSSGRRDRQVAIYAGSLGTFYNLSGIFAFFGVFSGLNKGSLLRIVTGYSPERVDEAARSAGVKDYAVETLEHDRMPEAYSGSCFSIIFYNRPLSAKGCCPIKLGESLACGVPVVLNSGAGDCDRIVEEGRVGVVLKDFSEGEYRRAAEELARLDADRENTRRRCRSVAERFFSLENGVRKYREIYERLAGR